jgi:hypothetical protein
MTDKPRYEAFTTPAGEAVFPWITKADTQHDPNGVYHVDLSVPAEEAQDFIAKLERVRDEFVATLPTAKQNALAKRPVYMDEMTRPEYPEGASKEQKAAIRDAWEGEPTGNVLFRIKMKAKVTTAEGTTFEQEPVVVSADTGERVESPVYGGSVIRVRGQIVPYTNAAAGIVGVTLRMKAVQVIDLVTGSGDAGGFWTDFEDEEAA